MAHRVEREIADVTYEDVDEAIKEHQHILGKYHALVTLSSVADFAPYDQFDALELIAELAALDGSARDASADEIAERDARTAKATSDTLVPQDHVVQWLRTWGTRE